MSAPALEVESRRVAVRRAGGLARVTLDRPPLNVLDLAMLEELHDELELLGADPSVKVLALAAGGRAFCSGVDVADHAADRVDRMLALFHGVLLRLRAMPFPTVAVVSGAALGGGCELMLACDLVLARADARVGQPEVRLGVFPPFAAAALPRLVGPQRAMVLVLTGEPLSAPEAQAVGLITRVLPVAGFEAAADAYLERLCALSGPVLRLAKRAVRCGGELPEEEALRCAEWLYAHELMALPDAHEGLAAFVEKRPPVWREG